jgi:hypothetical protein
MKMNMGMDTETNTDKDKDTYKVPHTDMNLNENIDINPLTYINTQIWIMVIKNLCRPNTKSKSCF